MRKNIQILDCTLRDGVYTNDWNFKRENIVNILQNLALAKADYIECGLFKENISYSEDKTIFSNIQDIQKLIKIKDAKYTLMINFGDYKIENIKMCKDSSILFRVAFKKGDLAPALEYCKELKNKGYSIFINPMQTNSYSEEELLFLLKKINEIKPFALTISDSMGTMDKNDINIIYKLIEKELDENITLCFHTHDNLGLCFLNVQTLIDLCKKRNLIIDSSISGLGRGAGNLKSEYLMHYLNKHYKKNYNLDYIIDIMDNYLDMPEKNSTAPYFLTAINSLHPNYGKFLAQKNISLRKMNEILKTIPEAKKNVFDSEYIEQAKI